MWLNSNNKHSTTSACSWSPVFTDLDSMACSSDRQSFVSQLAPASFSKIDESNTCVEVSSRILISVYQDDLQTWSTHFNHYQNYLSIHYTADDFATFFTQKVDSVQAATATTPLYDVPFKTSSLWWSLVTDHELHKLISCAPTKTCQLDPLSTWLVKDVYAAC